jgi:hypothetical protein
MKNELLKVEEIESEISIIEQSHHSAILSIHENMQQLINDCLSIDVSEDDKQTYDRAVELKRVVKSTHVSIEKKRKELKQPLIDYGKRLDRWVEEIYTPLVNAEKIVKKKMEVYEAKQEKLKQERKLIEDEKQKEELQLEIRLKNLNAQLERINSAKNKAELKEIEIYLDGIVISEFGSKSNEAGFILNQLKLTCSMASRLMKDEEEIPVEAPKMESTPITDDFLNDLKEMSNEPIKKVVIENELQDIQEVLIKNEEGIFEEVSIPVNEPVKESIAIKKASDEDVINIIDHISIDALPFVNNFIIEKTKSILGNVQAFDSLDFSEHNDLIFLEVKKRIGILLSNQITQK